MGMSACVAVVVVEGCRGWRVGTVSEQWDARRDRHWSPCMGETHTHTHTWVSSTERTARADMGSRRAIACLCRVGHADGLFTLHVSKPRMQRHAV